MTEPRLPEWFRRPIFVKSKKEATQNTIQRRGIHTICEQALCPHQGECFSQGTATFLVLGDICTRTCRFCAVKKGVPQPPNPNEATLLSQIVEDLQLSYVVITSVTRDDLCDGGAKHIADCVRTIKQKTPQISVETLIPDFNGDDKALETILKSGIDILSHNIEMPKSLFDTLRPKASFDRSIHLLSYAKEYADIPVKTGFMVGLGENDHDIFELLDLLANIPVDSITIGQYLQPSEMHHPVSRYVHPKQFTAYATYGKDKGIYQISSSPESRSSYHAKENAEDLGNADILHGKKM